MQIGKEICGAIQSRRSSIIKCGKTMATKLNKDSSSSQCKPGSAIQRAGKRAEKGRRKTSENQRSRGMGGGKNFE